MSSDGWPAITYETAQWPLGDPPHASRTQLRRFRGPYEAAVLPAIADEVLTLPAGVVAFTDDASQEIARFDAEMGGEIAPFGAVLLRSESAASSQIENLTASARAIAEAELGDTSRRNAAQIVANTRAMSAAIALSDRLDGESILVMHRALMEGVDPASAGRWRTQQVWIGGGNLGPHGALFVPPQHSRIESAIDDLVAFMRRDDLPVLPQAAVAHAQFETIHPFPDGNGRTGRALLHAMLRHKGLTRHVTIPISAGLLANTAAYFEALDAYRAGDPVPMITQLADASLVAVSNGRELVEQLRAIRQRWASRLTARSDSQVWRVADLVARRPVIDAGLVSAELGIAANNVHRYIEPLAKAGILTEFTDRRRNRAWRAGEILSVLDEFAVRSGRRSLPT